MENEIISDELIQFEAETVLERKLTSDECEEVYEKIIEGLSPLIQDSIYEVIDFNEMLERNKDADKTFPHYKTYHRNEVAYQPKFKAIGTFKNEEDARMFIRNDVITQYDQWQLVRVDKSGIEQEIYKIHC